MSNPGLGVGTLVGLAWGERLNEKDFAAAHARLKREIEVASTSALGGKAVATAATAVLNEVMKERAAEEAGTLGERRFSDPAAAKLRNRAFMDTASKELHRLSNGTLQFSVGRVDIVKTSDRGLDELLKDRRTMPTAERVRAKR